MSNFAFLTIKQLQEKLQKKEISSAELVGYYIERFKKYDDQLGSALEIFDKESILKKANLTNGILNGIPGISKDVICQEGRIASAGSKMLEHFKAPYDSTAIAKLKEQGVLIVGRANCDEFAMGCSNEYSAYKSVKNPWDHTKVAGGSSGGSTAAVAAGLVPWSLGTETGGSIRLPAAFCGIVGLKPTYGRVSRYGLIAYASSLDQIGVLTRTVYDNALVFSAIAGHDPKDSTTLNVPAQDYTKTLTGKIKPGLRLGVVQDALEAEGIDEDVKTSMMQVIKEYEKLGAKIKYVKLPSMKYSAATYFIVSRAEAASNLARFDGVRYGYRNKKADTLSQMYSTSRRDGFGLEVRLRILVGNYVLSVGHAAQFYQSAKKVQRYMEKEYNDLFKDVDLLLLPTQAAPAFKLGALTQNKLQMDLQDYFTCFINLIGAAAISVPCGFSKDNLPVGFQLAGPKLSEQLIFETAYAYEQATPWHTMYPKNYLE